MIGPPEDEPWYRSATWTAIQLIVFPPTGVYFMWRYHREWSGWFRWAVTGFWVLVLVGTISSSFASDDEGSSELAGANQEFLNSLATEVTRATQESELAASEATVQAEATETQATEQAEATRAQATKVSEFLVAAATVQAEATATEEAVFAAELAGVATYLAAIPPASATPLIHTPVPIVQQITYEIIERWAIPNGGEGKTIVISRDLLNPADMTRLGEMLLDDTRRDRNAFIFIFTDASAALVWSASLDRTPAEQELMNKHFIGSYTRNINTGFHKLEVSFTGFLTGDDFFTVEY